MIKQTPVQSMDDLVVAAGPSLIPFRQGDVIEVAVLQVAKSRVMVDVNGLMLGFIPERELSYDAHDLAVGERVLVYVLSAENDEGYAVLSLKRAEKEQTWRMLEEKTGAGDFLTVKIIQANRGGLLVRFGDVEGFIPVSQLSSQTLGRISDRDKLTERLNQLVGQHLKVKAITTDKAANRLIFSEKAVANVEAEERVKALKPGDVVEGKITGIVDYGLFMDIGGIEGLIHISEVAWERIDDLKARFSVGETLEVRIVDIDGSRVSLSRKRLQPDPWAEGIKKYKIGDVVEGEVTRVTPFGAFIKFEPALDGLVRVNEIVDEGQTPGAVLEVSKRYPFKILTIDAEARQIGLSYKQAQT